MKLVILSDTHDNLSNFKKVLSFLKKEKIKILLHCGDVCRSSILQKLKRNFKGKIFLALGNADIRETIFKFGKKYPNLKIFKDFGVIKVDKLKIAFCHFLDLAKKLCQTKKYNFVFYGHTHRPWLKKTRNCILANPGNLANLYNKPTFAVLDTKNKKLTLKLLEEIKKSS